MLVFAALTYIELPVSLQTDRLVGFSKTPTCVSTDICGYLRVFVCVHVRGCYSNTLSLTLTLFLTEPAQVKERIIKQTLMNR